MDFEIKSITKSNKGDGSLLIYVDYGGLQFICFRTIERIELPSTIRIKPEQWNEFYDLVWRATNIYLTEDFNFERTLEKMKGEETTEYHTNKRPKPRRKVKQSD